MSMPWRQDDIMNKKNKACELKIIFAFNWDSEFFKIFAQSEKSKEVVEYCRLFSDDFSELVKLLDDEDEFL